MPRSTNTHIEFVQQTTRSTKTHTKFVQQTTHSTKTRTKFAQQTTHSTKTRTKFVQQTTHSTKTHTKFVQQTTHSTKTHKILFEPTTHTAEIGSTKQQNRGQTHGTGLLIFILNQRRRSQRNMISSRSMTLVDGIALSRNPSCLLDRTPLLQSQLA